MFIFDQQVKVSDGSIGTIRSIYKDYFSSNKLNEYEFAIKGRFFYILLLGEEYIKNDMYGNTVKRRAKKVLLRKPVLIDEEN